MSTIFSQQILCNKLLLDFNWNNHLNYALKKQQTRNQNKKIVCKTVNFGLPNLTKPKMKSKNVIKCHNIFTIPLFSAVVSFSQIFFYLFYKNTIYIIFS